MESNPWIYLKAAAAAFAFSILATGQAEAAARLCEDKGLSTVYLSKAVDGLTAEAIANDFLADIASRAAPGRAPFTEIYGQFFSAIAAFEHARLSPEEAAGIVAGEWKDWRASHMSRDEFIWQFLAEVSRRKDRGIPEYGATLQAAQAMRNRLDDLQRAAGRRELPDDQFQMWTWDSYIRGKAAAAEIEKLRAMRGGGAYWNDYLVARKTTLACAAAKLEQRRTPGTGSPAVAAASSGGQRCDELAAHPADPDKPQGVAGVPDDAIDASAALEACTAAVESQPDEPRFAFQLGRVLMLGGERDLASGFLNDAAAGGSAAALAYLGDLEEDDQSARALYEAAAAGGFAPAAALLVPASESGARCDTLAAHPDDPARPAAVAGVADKALDPRAAFDACVAAAESNPGEARYRFQLGRALALMEGMSREAAEQLRLASEAGHAGAAAYLAAFVERDDEAERLLEKAAAAGFAPARETLADLRQAVASAAAPAVFDGTAFRRPKMIGTLASARAVPVGDESMGYLFGFLDTYLPNCPWLGKDGDLPSVVKFYQAAEARVTTKIFENPLGTLESLVPYDRAARDGDADSYRFIETYGCEGPVPEKFTEGLVKTIVATSGAGRSVFVESCAHGRLNQRQCQCLADLGRGVFADIHERTYDRGTIPSLVSRNPIFAFQIGVQCGIGDY